MSTNELTAFFNERFSEIETYLDFLQEVENATRKGPPRIQGASAPISASQQKILNSSLYLQLYNLVEATVSRCLDAVVNEVCTSQRLPGELNASLRTEWIRAIAKTHIVLSPSNRLEATVAMCDHLLSQLPVANFTVEAGGGGNWDDDAIEAVSKRVGCKLQISRNARMAVKRHFRDDMGALKLVKNRRNGLAHGSLSFVDCSDGISVAELRVLTTSVGGYLKEAVSSFGSYIASDLGPLVSRKSTGVA